MDEVGRNARTFSKLIDTLRGKGKLHEGICIQSGGTVRVELNHRSFQQLKKCFVEITNDNRIIAVALNLMLEEKERPNGKEVVLVSKDALVRVKADAYGLIAEDFLSDRVVDIEKMYTGFIGVDLYENTIDDFYNLGEINIDIIESISYS